MAAGNRQATYAEKRLKKGAEELLPSQAAYGGPRSVTRLLAMFDQLARAPDGMSLAELNVSLNSPKSSILNLLRPLLAEGYVVHDGATYFLGPSMFRLAAGVMAGWNFPKLIRPFLTELSSRTEETVVLSLLDRRSAAVTYVEIIEGFHPVRYHIPVGTIRPILSTAAGKIMLAHVDTAWRDTYLASVHFPVKAVPPVTRPALMKELARIRVQGVAVSLDRHIVGVSAVAAPVFDAAHKCVCALTIAGPTQRFRASLDSLVVAIREVAAKASGAITRAYAKPTA